MMNVVCITHKSLLPQRSIFVRHFFGSLNLALGRSQTTKMLSRFRPGTEIAIRGCQPLSCVKIATFDNSKQLFTVVCPKHAYETHWDFL